MKKISNDGTELVGGGKNRFPFSLISLLLFSTFLFVACGGGGGGNGGTGGTSHTVKYRVTGTSTNGNITVTYNDKPTKSTVQNVETLPWEQTFHPTGFMSLELIADAFSGGSLTLEIILDGKIIKTATCSSASLCTATDNGGYLDLSGNLQCSDCTSIPDPGISNGGSSSCPSGTTGTYPNCTALTCPSGTTGTYPNCTALVCSAGMHGTYPNCTHVVKYQITGTSNDGQVTVTYNYKPKDRNTAQNTVSSLPWSQTFYPTGFMSLDLGALAFSGGSLTVTIFLDGAVLKTSSCSSNSFCDVNVSAGYLGSDGTYNP